MLCINAVGGLAGTRHHRDRRIVIACRASLGIATCIGRNTDHLSSFGGSLEPQIEGTNRAKARTAAETM